MSMNEPLVPGPDVPQAGHFELLFDPGTVLAAVVGHRRRFRDSVGSLTADELASPSRCEGWTVADVLRHGIWVDGTFRRIWSGEGSTLKDFDPRTTPNEFVESNRAVPDEEIRRRYLSSTEDMVIELESAQSERFGDLSVTPAGAVPWWLSVVHLGWDSTVHERDALSPLGHKVEANPAETLPFLAYCLVLSSFFAGPDPLDVRVADIRLQRGTGPVTAWAITTAAEADDERLSDPTSAVLTGEPTDIIDALSGRAPLTDVLNGQPAVVERLGGLATYFTSSN